MTERRKMAWPLVYLVVCYVCGVFLGTGLVDSWGQWYSQSIHFRSQTDALLRGELALSHDPGALTHDLAWANGTVQQVWGLGIPIWRLPFEFVATILGLGGFPDRLAYAIALGLWAWLVIWVLAGHKKHSIPKDTSEVDDPENESFNETKRIRTGWILDGVQVAVVLLFPPFLTLNSSRFDVYEEVLAYTYLFGTWLFMGVLELRRHPTWGRFWLLCLLAGFGPMVRPTLLFYGVGTVLAGSWVMWQRPSLGCVHTNDDDSGLFSWRKISLALASRLTMGVALLCLSGGLLFWTNHVRFGSGVEFGHRLNLQNLYGSMYATRFDDPYQNEPVLSAALELASWLFLTPEMNGGNYYKEDFFVWQSPTLRWRESYLRTFDLSYLPLLVVGWYLAVTQFWRSRRAMPGRSAVGPINGVEDGRCSLLVLSFIWSLMPVVMLSVFYLKNSVMASRYVLDYAPAFAAILLGAISGLQTLSISSAVRTVNIVASFILIWLIIENAIGRSCYGPPGQYNWHMLDQRKALKSTKTEPLPDEYAVVSGTSNAVINSMTMRDRSVDDIPYNGAGWDLDSGYTAPQVTLFVEDLDRLELDLELHSPIKLPPTEDPWRWVRAKVGLEMLERAEVIDLPKGKRIRFHRPKQENYQHGLQAVFLALGPPALLSAAESPFRLVRVRWHSVSRDSTSKTTSIPEKSPSFVH